MKNNRLVPVYYIQAKFKHLKIIKYIKIKQKPTILYYILTSSNLNIYLQTNLLTYRKS